MGRSIRTAVTETVGAEDIARAESPSTRMAFWPSQPSRAVIARRRAKNKAARLARRAARR